MANANSTTQFTPEEASTFLGKHILFKTNKFLLNPEETLREHGKVYYDWKVGESAQVIGVMFHNPDKVELMLYRDGDTWDLDKQEFLESTELI